MPAPAGLASELGHRVLGGCRAGDALTIVSGEERLYLQDYNAEIWRAEPIQLDAK